MDAGLRENYDGVTGHTLGFSSTARPTDLSRAFLPTSDWVLESGMVFHMYTRGRGIGISETIHVSEHGPERLTKLERELFSR
jgi:Xaa-Pro dipeptidase